MEDTKFKLLVSSREGILYKGDVISITSFNQVGEFDVLAKHANFISLINKGLIIREQEGMKKEISFDNALLRVREDNVEVYVGVEGMAPSLLKQSNIIIGSNTVTTK